ncbi:fibronectin type III domain-containing protein [Streptomyces sp. NBC_01483]|uniref:fibronectin type III domain-containing protein n=1 Tax=Streptomyces sp. NBC_01483 TaxID=2903883 RepID=UPI003FCD3CAC
MTTVDRTALAAPAGLIATSLSRGLQLDWNGVTGAVSYRVYRATSENGVYSEVGRTDKLSYLDTSAVESVTYYYRVTVLDAAGNEPARSTAAAGERGGQRARAFHGRRRRARGPHPAARRHRADGHPDRVRLRAGVGQEPGRRPREVHRLPG